MVGGGMGGEEDDARATYDEDGCGLGCDEQDDSVGEEGVNKYETDARDLDLVEAEELDEEDLLDAEEVDEDEVEQSEEEDLCDDGEDDGRRAVHYGAQMRRFEQRSRGVGLEKCVTVGVAIKSQVRAAAAVGGRAEAVLPSDESMRELAALAETASMRVVGSVTQALDAPIAATYIGSGKVAEIVRLLDGTGAKTVVFDDELSPAQQRTLERAFGGEPKGIKVLDRTALILDIFAQHAQTREGKLQVELALYQYRLPRLTKMWTHLERQSGMGGVGLRGPGETQLEVDRRLIQNRVSLLKRQIDAVRVHRTRQRVARKRLGVPIVCIAGYTNAGKSSLCNALATGADVVAEDMLFATLDTKTCLAELPGMRLQPHVLLTDTVGFIQKLPTQLVAAFRATLEEVAEADVVLHVVDASNPCREAHRATVDMELAALGAGDKPQVVVWNKADLLSQQEREELMSCASSGKNGDENSIQERRQLQQMQLGKRHGEGDLLSTPPQTRDREVVTSVYGGTGLVELIEALEDTLRDLMMSVEVLIPFSRGSLVAEMHERGVVESELHRSNGTLIAAAVPSDLVMRLKPYRVDIDSETDISSSETERQEADGGEDEFSEAYWKRLAKKRTVAPRS